MAAREHDVRAQEKAPLALTDCRVREAEGRELVHAVVDDRRRRDPVREGVHHGRVEPEHGRLGQTRRDQHVEEAAQRLRAPGLVPPARQPRPERDHSVSGKRVVFEVRQVVVAGDVLCEDEHPALAGEAAHQVLRPLRD